MLFYYAMLLSLLDVDGANLHNYSKLRQRFSVFNIEAARPRGYTL